MQNAQEDRRRQGETEKNDGRRDHKPQTLCVCVLCSHDAVCCAPAGFGERGERGERNENEHVQNGEKIPTQPQRKHNYIVGFRNGAAKTSTDDRIVYK